MNIDQVHTKAEADPVQPDMQKAGLDALDYATILALLAAGFSRKIYRLLHSLHEKRLRAVERTQKEALLKGRVQPTRIADAREMQEALQEFTCIAGNASYEDAEVVILGEKHMSMENPFLEYNQGIFTILKFLHNHLQTGDVYLLEGVPRGEVQKINDYSALIQVLPHKGINVRGWDTDDQERMEKSRGIEENFEEADRFLINERNAQFLLPEILKQVDVIRSGRSGQENASWSDGKGRNPKIFVQAGSRHITNDTNVEKTLHKQGVKFLLLVENSALEAWMNSIGC